MKAKRILVCGLLVVSYSVGSVTHAEEVVGRSPDRIGGQLTGGYVAFLVGGAAGGPLGAIAGGAIGAWVGGVAQESLGLAGERYQLKTESGELITLRSPNHRFELGDEVRIERGRPRPIVAQIEPQLSR